MAAPSGRFIHVRFTGINELVRVLEGLPDSVARREQLKILVEASEPLRVDMWALAPVGTATHGRHLKDSMVTSVVRDRGGSGDATVAVGPSKDAFWGFFQEFGTVHHGPQPFASTAFDNQTKRTFEEISKGYWSLIRRRVLQLRGF